MIRLYRSLGFAFAVVFLCMSLRVEAQLAASTAQTTVHVGLAYQRTGSGFSISPTVGYRITKGIEAVLQGSFSDTEFTKARCLAFDSDTIALLPGSLFYLGEDQRDANVFISQRAEVLTGANVILGDRIRFVSSLRFGASWITVESAVDSRSYAQAARHPGLECGEPFQDFNAQSGPIALENPTEFSTNAVAGVMSLGIGVEALTDKDWRIYGMLHNRQLIYGSTRFLVQDPRRPGFGSFAARIRDHAPSAEFRLELGVMVPLRGI
jgi:hypothetical protein